MKSWNSYLGAEKDICGVCYIYFSNQPIPPFFSFFDILNFLCFHHRICI